MYKDIIKKSKDYFGVVYKLTNNITSKVYIGQTINLTARIRQYRYESKNKITIYRPISDAVYEYKFKNFTIEILNYCNSLDEMNYYETYWIKKLNTLFPNGYNNNYGGDNYIRKKGISTWTDDRIDKHSIPIIVYDSDTNKFFKYKSAAYFANFIYRPRTHVTRAVKHGIAVKKYYVFYYDKKKLKNIINTIENEIIVRKNKYGKVLRAKDEYLRLANLIYNRSVEIIEPYIIII